MGHAYKYRCSRCNFEQDFNQGHGFLVRSQPLAEFMAQNLKVFHYKTTRVLNALVKINQELYLKSGFQIYKCPKCKIMFDKKEVVVYDDSTEVYRSEYRCSKCRSRLKLTNIHRLKKTICPACGKRTFHIDTKNVNLWD